MKVLAIETSCDETAIALLEATGGLKKPRFEVLKNLVASQIKIHRPFGGVVPNLAKREHLKNLPILLRQIFKSKVKGQKLKVDVVAVTMGPGLEPALWTGINFAKKLAREFKKPLIGVNHLEGHLYSFLLKQKTVSSRFKVQGSGLFPAIALIVSGGHTILLKMDSLTKWKKLGETRDDAAGEAFDKVARLLNLDYPGGPEIEKLALSLPKDWHDPINFPRPMINQKNYDFSFAGLKTAVFYKIKELRTMNHELKINVAAAFQRAVVDVLTAKTLRAAKEFGAKTILLSGGVAANKLLRQVLRQQAKRMKLNFFAPLAPYNIDNAAMIAAAAYIKILRDPEFDQGKRRPKFIRLAARANLNL